MQDFAPKSIIVTVFVLGSVFSVKAVPVKMNRSRNRLNKTFFMYSSNADKIKGGSDTYRSRHRLLNSREPAFFQPQSHIYKSDQHRHFYQWSDNRNKRLAGIQAKHGDSHGNGKLKVIGGGGKG